jgi:hypothetical protein
VRGQIVGLAAAKARIALSVADATLSWALTPSSVPDSIFASL